MNRLIWGPALCLALGAAVVRAATPVDADPNRDYPITPEAGPWMICASYFTGPSAPDLARQMVYHIRSRYGTPAYVFNNAEEERKKQQELVNQHRQALPFDAPPPGSEEVVPIPRRHVVVHIEEQCAVLIGGYPDENTAHAALLVVKKWPAPQLKAPEGVLPFGSVIDHGKETMMNPFAMQSMVVRNPTLANAAKPRSMADDPFLKTLNADEEFSMLECPGTWTLAVQEYVGAAMVQQQQAESSGFLKMIGLGGTHAGESLAVAANNAHELAKMLHQRGAEVYVLHTRTSSVVSIGSFSSPKDPRMKEACEQYAKWQASLARLQPEGAKQTPMGLFPTPVPVEVPHP